MKLSYWVAVVQQRYYERGVFMMTYKEQTERQQIITEARKMFPEESNITKRMELYRKATGIELKKINTKDANRPLSPLDDYERIKCDMCGSDMRIRSCPENVENIKTQLVCTNTLCDNVLNSEYTMQDWLNVLVKR